jgi:hypothetical protein
MIDWLTDPATWGKAMPYLEIGAMVLFAYWFLKLVVAALDKPRR